MDLQVLGEADLPGDGDPDVPSLNPLFLFWKEGNSYEDVFMGLKVETLEVSKILEEIAQIEKTNAG